MRSLKTLWALALGMTFAASARGQFALAWYTVDGGGHTFSTGDAFSLGGTIGQPDAGVMAGGNFTLTGGFWAAASSSGIGVPAATVTAAISRKANPAGTGGACDTPLIPALQSEPHQGGITTLRIRFDVAPGGPGATSVAIEQATCAQQAYAPYSGSAAMAAAVEGNELVLSFTPGLENARTYRLTMGSDVTSIAGQFVGVRGLMGDVNGAGRANATDRSVVVGVWTGAGFSCATDLNSTGGTNATDRSIVVGAWTGGQNCAP